MLLSVLLEEDSLDVCSQNAACRSLGQASVSMGIKKHISRIIIKYYIGLHFFCIRVLTKEQEWLKNISLMPLYAAW